MRNLQIDSKVRIQQLADIMMWANNCGRDGYAGMESVYGFCYEAIISIVLTETGVNIRYCNDWNLGGNSNYLEDIEIALDNQRQKIIDAHNDDIVLH